MDLRICCREGPDDSLSGLLGWLRDESDLRGRIRPESTPSTVDRMGSTVTALLIAAGGGAVSALINAAGLFLTRVRSATTLEVVHSSGQSVKLSGPDITHEDLERAIAALRAFDQPGQAPPGPPPAGQAPPAGPPGGP
jgi:hypothetical protein